MPAEAIVSLDQPLQKIASMAKKTVWSQAFCNICRWSSITSCINDLKKRYDNKKVGGLN